MKNVLLASYIIVFFSQFAVADNSFIHNVDVRGNTGSGVRGFTEYQKLQGSVFGEIEVHWQSESTNNSFTTTLFGRMDSLDSERTHADIREFMWLYYTDSWEIKAGIGKVFWGVTESAHRVDIINQTDSVETPDGEAKLGQPMINWSGIYHWGTVDAFVLPYFRERTLASIDSPLNIGLFISDAIYESDKKQEHTDYALRYSQTVGVWDLGLSYFKGTDRAPVLAPVVNSEGIQLVPYYLQIEQAGLEVQATLGSWLWKLEAIHQENNRRNYAALTAGFEYTLISIADSAKDLGLLVELHRDSRNGQADDPLQHDLFVGARLTFNDISDTAFLVGVIQDLTDSDSRLAFIEASRRMGDDWTVSLDGRMYLSETPENIIYGLRKADHITLEATYHF
ncbi:hypothetical protein [Marinagarivorans algicola]|uniref:hypothetical protein n=1 Tax=Marinagarivorans algicola TaxID=1513270 RepID=UPI0006B40227|nr:hypothetical protein [Marinagarivorans algicola]